MRVVRYFNRKSSEVKELANPNSKFRDDGSLMSKPPQSFWYQKLHNTTDQSNPLNFILIVSGTYQKLA